MKAIVRNGSFKESFLRLYEENGSIISQNDIPYTARIRSEGFSNFRKLDLPGRKNELWKNTDLTDVLNQDYIKYLEKAGTGRDLEFMFTCDVHNFETDQVSFLNGWHVSTAKDLRQLPERLLF